MKTNEKTFRFDINLISHDVTYYTAVASSESRVIELLESELKNDNDYKVVMAPTATVGSSEGASNLTFHNANLYSYDKEKNQCLTPKRVAYSKRQKKWKRYFIEHK